jgi:hypothetical protein
MSNNPEPMHTRSYQIRIKGQFDATWTDWFAGLTVTPEAEGTTLLTAEGIDQAALYGILKKIRDLGISLISVNSNDAKFYKKGNQNEER